MPPCPSLLNKIPVPPLPRGQRWSWVALHARHCAWCCSFGGTQQNWPWSPTLVHILCLLHSGHPTWLFLVSQTAYCSQRTGLDAQNMYILKALAYSTTLSSRSQSCPVCPTLCNPKDYTGHGLLQARILEWIAFPFSRGSSKPRH